MTRRQLEQLSKAELIEIVLGLQARLVALEDQVNRLTQPPKDASNSSTPPSKTRKPNRPDRKPQKKRGPKPGHQGRSRKRQEPDVIVECRPALCDRCGGGLPQAGGRLLGTRQVVEIPPVQPVVIEARRYGCAGPGCGHRQAGEYPPGLEPQRVFSPRLEAIVCYLHHLQHVSYERLAGLCHGLFALDLSQGAIANIIARAAAGLQPQAQAILEQVRTSPVIGCDETGARVDGLDQWQWVFETAQASFHLIAPSRAARVIADSMGDAMPEVWLSNCFSAQLRAPTEARQLCHAHQLRDLQFAVDAECSEFACRMQRLLLRSQGLARRRRDLPAEVFADQVAQIERACDTLLSAPARGRHGRRLQKRYRKHREALLTFLYRADVSPDDNACERALRKSVVHRKVSGGLRSEWGAAAFATTATVIETAANRGEDALSVLTGLLTPGPPLLSLTQPP